MGGEGVALAVIESSFRKLSYKGDRLEAVGSICTINKASLSSSPPLPFLPSSRRDLPTERINLR
jgi:hypothetical protein